MTSGYFFAILTGIFFGLQGTFGKILGKKLPPSLTTWGMFTFSLPFLALLLLYQGIPEIELRTFIWSTGERRTFC